MHLSNHLLIIVLQTSALAARLDSLLAVNGPDEFALEGEEEGRALLLLWHYYYEKEGH
jgi:hypothetical protein